LSEEMADDGYTNIKNIDLSLTCIKQMQEAYKDKYPTMPFEQMDVRSMNYDDGAFDAIVDKGTFDSILCGDGSGPNADQMLSEIHRVLSAQGVYICISYGVKETRLKYFAKADYSWTVFQHMVAKPTISTS
jgi:ubiquinone/menaquinone biosynthesis C-methylase UbiE